MMMMIMMVVVVVVEGLICQGDSNANLMPSSWSGNFSEQIVSETDGFDVFTITDNDFNCHVSGVAVGWGSGVEVLGSVLVMFGGTWRI